MLIPSSGHRSETGSTGSSIIHIDHKRSSWSKDVADGRRKRKSSKVTFRSHLVSLSRRYISPEIDFFSALIDYASRHWHVTHIICLKEFLMKLTVAMMIDDVQAQVQSAARVFDIDIFLPSSVAFLSSNDRPYRSSWSELSWFRDTFGLYLWKVRDFEPFEPNILEPRVLSY